MDKEQLLREISEDCQKLQDTLNRVQSGLDRLQKILQKNYKTKCKCKTLRFMPPTPKI